MVKNITVQTPGFVITADNDSGIFYEHGPAFYIERDIVLTRKATIGAYSVAMIEKEERQQLQIESDIGGPPIDNSGRFYPYITLISMSKYVTICKAGYFENCQQSIEKSPNSLGITQPKAIWDAFYNNYRDNQTNLSLLDWEVKGMVIGDKKDRNKTTAEFTVTGNYKFIPPSDEWITSWEEFNAWRARALYTNLTIQEYTGNHRLCCLKNL